MAELELDELSSRVLDLVDLIPAGRLVTYGDLAALVGTGPRQVGRVLATHGQLSHWWRVVRADGGSQVAARARGHWEAEGIAHDGGAPPRARLGDHRLSGAELAELGGRDSD